MYLKTDRRKTIDLVNDTGSAEPGFELKWKAIFLYLSVFIVFIFIFLNLFELQIVKGSQNLAIASRTNQSTIKVLPPRGLIYDQAGIKLAYNVPAYSVYVKTREIKQTAEEGLIQQLAAVLGADSNDLLATFKAKAYQNEKRIAADRITLKSDLTYDQYLALITELDKMPGVYVNVEPVREYNNSVYFSHILGYVGDPDNNDLAQGIFSESQVGKVGIEKSYDKYLRGVEGTLVKEKEAFTGNETSYTTTEAKSGDNIYLTLDSTWQIKLQQIMDKQLHDVRAFASAGVIMNSKTGEVKAMISIPSYDNNLFAKGINGKDYGQLLNDIKQPLFNRAIGLQLPPGSTFKVIGATAALEEKVISKNTIKYSNRCMELPGKIKFCEADAGFIGNVDVEHALSKSSNLFFCQVALDMANQGKGILTLDDYAARYGIGQKTGIDIPGEGAGTMASPDLKKRLYNEPWYLGDICNSIIGQGLVTTTPLQMTQVVSAVSNGGNIITPHLLAKVENQSGQTVQVFSPATKSLNVSAATLKIIHDGMRLTATEGTAAGLKGLPGNIIAKTGSSDAGQYINGKYISGAHSWVVGCFDFQGENYCFTVMQQWGGRGYKTVPIMKKFINCLYSGFADKCENV